MTVVDDYLEAVEEPQKSELERIRRIIKQLVPDAEEVITYGMPGFKYKKKYLISFGAFKNHMSVFPGATPVDTLASQLAGYKLSKGTIQVTLEKPLPSKLLQDIVLLCKARID